MSLVKKIKQVLRFPPEGRSIELWRAMEIQEAVITLNSHGLVELTVYAKDFSHKTVPLFDFKDVLKILSSYDIVKKQKIRELADLLKNRPETIRKVIKKDGEYVLEGEKWVNPEKTAIWFDVYKKKFVEAFGVEVATALVHQNEGSGSLNGQEAEDEGAIPSSSDLGVESETEKIMKDKKLFTLLQKAWKKGSHCSPYKPLVESAKKET